MFRISDWSKRNLQSAVPIQDPAVCDSVRKCRPGVLETGTVDEYDGRHPQKVNQKKKEKENLHEYQYFNKRIKRTRSVELSDRGYPREISHGAIPGALAMKTEEIETSDAIDRTKKTIICCSRGRFSVAAAEEAGQEKEVHSCTEK
mgnify:CR=1 FL=1